VSLDVYLTVPREPQPNDHICNCTCCGLRAPTTTQVYERNTTHNHGRIAAAVGLYAACWRPDENGITKAAQLVEPLRAGLAKLEQFPAAYRHLEPGNGWGSVEHFTQFVREYLRACEANPDADVSVSR
jgi:hypothetical protein